MIFIVLFVAITGCQFNSQKYKAGDLPIIDISKNYPQKKIHLQDIADVEYVPLETANDVLIGKANLRYVSDKYIVLYDLTQDEIFVFNRNGKILSHFNHKGQGGQEYINISNLFFDEKNEEIYVSSFSTHRLLVYSISGDYKRTIKYSNDFIFLYAYNFDDSTLLVYDYAVDNAYNNKPPYMLMSKKDGSIVSNIDIQLPVRYTSRVVEKIEINGQKVITARSFDTSNNIYYGQDFVLSEISSDTIYRLTCSRELTPMLVRKPPVHSSDPPTVWSVLLTTDKFIILNKKILDPIAFEKGQEATSEMLMYEFETGQTYIPSFANDDFRGVPWYPAVVMVGVDTPKNMHALTVPAKIIRIFYKEIKLKGKIKNFEKMPDEDDNPGVMIVKFK